MTKSNVQVGHHTYSLNNKTLNESQQTSLNSMSTKKYCEIDTKQFAVHELLALIVSKMLIVSIRSPKTSLASSKL